MSANKKIFVKDFLVKDNVDTTLLVKHIALMQSRDGKDYLNLILGDKTGQIEGRMWQRAKEISSKISKGDLVQACGKINLFQSRRQFIVSDIYSLDQSEVDLSDFILSAATDGEKMFGQLVELIESLDDVYIKDLLLAMVHDHEISDRLKRWPAGKTIHHAYQSGLLEHILSCSELSLILSKHYGVNKNYVVAGAILHDLCKIYELTDGLNTEYTDEGKLVGHLVKGVELLEHFCSKMGHFPYKIKMHLKHILLSHHGEYQFGSPKLPQTSEAYLVHLIDLLDSRMSALEMVKKNDQLEGPWSGFVKHLDRVVYKDALPTFSEYVVIDNEAKKHTPQKKSHPPKEIKQNLGNLLKDFKVTD